MISRSLLHCLSFCKRAVSVAILFSSLVCGAWTETIQAAITSQQPAVIFNSRGDSAVSGARVAGKPYTVDASGSITIRPDTYSQILLKDGVNFSSGKMIFGAGEVVLEGGSGIEMIFPVSTTATKANAQIQIYPQGGDATLQLQEGNLIGNLYLHASRPRTATVLVGTPASDGTMRDVTINGTIYGSLGSQYPEAAIVKTNGANLEVFGDITGVGTLESSLGNITVSMDSPTAYTGGGISVVALSLQPGTAITANNETAAAHLFLRENSTLRNDGPLNRGNTASQLGRIDVMNAIDGTETGGILGKGSQLISTEDSVYFWGGVEQGSGLVSAGRNISAYQTKASAVSSETMIMNIRQGEGNSLTLNAKEDVVGGNIDVDAITASGSYIIAGSRIDSKKVPANRLFVSDQYTVQSIFPRGSITAKEIKAPNGGIYAGEINVSSGEMPQIEAKNLLVVKMEADGDLPATSGNVNLANAAFKLTGEGGSSGWKNAEGPKPEYAAQIEGSLNSTSNGDSSFTTMKVGDAASVAGGTLIGDLLDTGSLDFSANSASISETHVGAAARVSGGSYVGANFTADNATFTDVGNISFSDSLLLETGLTMANSVADRIETATIKNGDAKISGGSYAGASLKARNAAFTGVTGVTLSSVLDLSGNLNLDSTGLSSIKAANIDGDASISNGSYSGETFTATNAGFSALESVNLSGNFTAKANATFENVNALNVAGLASVGGDFTQTGGSATLADLAVGNRISVASAYLKAKDASAVAAKFDNNSSAEFDDLKLTGSDLTLVIEEGSTVFINNSLTDLKGIEAIQGGKLIIHGYNDAPSTRPELYIDKDTELVQERGIFDLTDGLYGGDKDGKTSIANFSQLTAGEIEITNVDLTLAGIGNFANRVNKNLIIHQNGNTRLGDISVGGFAQIDGGSVTAAQMKVAGDASFDAVALDLSGSGDSPSTIGGNLIISNNSQSSLGGVNVARDTQISGGTLEALQLETGSATFAGAIQANIRSLLVTSSSGSLNIGAPGEGRSTVTASAINLNGAPLTVYGESALQISSGLNGGDLAAGAISIPDAGLISAFGDINAESVTLGQPGAELAGANVAIRTQLSEMKGGAITATDGDVELGGGARDAVGSITANADIFSGTGSDRADLSGPQLDLDAGKNIAAGAIEVNTLKAGADIDARDISVKALTAGGNVRIGEGSLNLTGSGSKIGGDLIATANVKSSLGTLEVGGETRFANGEIKASTLTTGAAHLDNIKAAFDELVLKDPATDSDFALTSTAANGSGATVGSLNLNGGMLNLALGSGAPVNLYVGQFAGQANVINGNIAVNKNGLLVLGAQNAGILQMPNAIAPSGMATFALAQPMRLDSRFGIHVTGAGNANPLPNSIKFDASSLFVIDSRMSSAVYAYMGSLDSIIPSAQLSATNGAIGALSADKASTPANVNMGAQIYIRNPRVNTVIVALGENISTFYADKAARAGDTGAAPWTGVNLDYDNKNTVKITRLENQYAGQFLVLPINAPDPIPPTPENPTPPTPVDPTPPTPADPTPVDPTPVNPTPPTPAEPTPVDPTPPTPADPTPVDPTPVNPTPPTPAEPTPVDPTPTEPTPVEPTPPTPDNPEPDEPEPDEPEIPVTPVEPVQPLQPGQQFIEDAHAVFEHDPGKAQQVINSASHLATAGGVPHLIHAATTSASEVILNRARILDILAEGEEMTGKSFALWALPLYKAISGYGLSAGNGNYGYAGGIGGVIMGADITFAEKLRAGIDFNIGGGYTKSSGDLAQTENNMNFWGLGAYAGYREGNFGVEAEFSFTSSYNKVRQDTPGDLGWGELKADIPATAVSASLRAEYRFETEMLDIVPHAGARYLNLHALSYDIDASGRGTIVEGGGFYQNIWTFPFGLYLGKTFELENGVKILPSLDFTVIPATGDLETKNRIQYTGEIQEIDLRSRFMDDITYGGSAGIEVQAGDFTIGINYSGQFGRHTSSNGVFGLLRYEF